MNKIKTIFNTIFKNGITINITEVIALGLLIWIVNKSKLDITDLLCVFIICVILISERLKAIEKAIRKTDEKADIIFEYDMMQKKEPEG